MTSLIYLPSSSVLAVFAPDDRQVQQNRTPLLHWRGSEDVLQLSFFDWVLFADQSLLGRGITVISIGWSHLEFQYPLVDTHLLRLIQMGQKGKNEDRVRGCLFFRAQLLSRYADQFGNVDFSEVLPTLQHSVQRRCRLNRASSEDLTTVSNQHVGLTRVYGLWGLDLRCSLAELPNQVFVLQHVLDVRTCAPLQIQQFRQEESSFSQNIWHHCLLSSVVPHHFNHLPAVGAR